MSADLQARKRRDKRKRKDDASDIPLLQQPPPTVLSPSSSTPTEDLNVPIRKEPSTGGSLCAKFVFFILLSVIVVFIGLNITEHRGITDLEKAETESYFAQFFEGWVDTHAEDHDHDDEVPSLEHSEEDAEDDDEHDEDSVTHTEEDEEDDPVEDTEETEENESAIQDETAETESIQEDTVEDSVQEETAEVDSYQEETAETESIQEETAETESIQDETAETVEESEVLDESEAADDENSDKADLSTEYSQQDEETKETQDDEEEYEEEEEEEEEQDETLEKDEESAEVDLDLKDSTGSASKKQEYDKESEEQDEEEDDNDKNDEEIVKSSEKSVDIIEESEKSEEVENQIEDEIIREDNQEEAKPENEEEKEEKDINQEENVADETLSNDDPDTTDRQHNSVNMYTDELSEGTDSEDDLDRHSRHTGAQSMYEFENITNSDDWEIRDKLDSADEYLNRDAAYALTLFNAILKKNSSSSRALYGKAKCLDVLAEKKKSNSLLQQAILTYQEVLKTPKIPDYLFQIVAERCIDRMRFRGLYQDTLQIHHLLISKFPKDVRFRNSLAVTYLTINKITLAKLLLEETLADFPNNGFALVHYGFILKTSENDLAKAVDYLKRGIATNEPGVIDGRFYFHLGDALTRLGRNADALKLYEEGVKHKLFLSKYQRSLYNVERLKGKPWWSKEEVGYKWFLNNLQSNWKHILREGLGVLGKNGYFIPEAENLRDVGDWKQFTLFARGNKQVQNCKLCPNTCKIIETFADAAECKRGQVKFSVMHPGTHVWPHCGPTNCRLRVHLGLKIPLGTYIRVGDETRSWKEGELLIFDDSFEHEVWHNGSTFRLVLIVDVWHPELTKEEKRKLSPI